MLGTESRVGKAFISGMFFYKETLIPEQSLTQPVSVSLCLSVCLSLSLSLFVSPSLLQYNNTFEETPS